MKIAVPREVFPGERRVALMPEAVASLVQSGFEVWVEKGAGEGAYVQDSEYEKAGAKIMNDAGTLLGEADVVLKVQGPSFREPLGRHEADLLKEGAVWISFLYPEQYPESVQKFLDRKVSAFAMERIPRLSRAQRMDALSSQSTVAGYLAVLLAAEAIPRFFPLLMTAAGTIPPARVFVLGAGVAGLTAIATARRLGARVEAFDVRPVVKEQVESLGATFVGVAMQEAAGAGGYAKALSQEMHRKEQELLKAHVREVDVVITTALIPGKKAPILVTAEMVRGMKPGSVIVDLAAEQGGNCELTKPGQTVSLPSGIKILGPLNLPAQMPFHASAMYSRNISSFLAVLTDAGKLSLDFKDDLLRGACVAHQGKVLPPQAEHPAATKEGN